MTSTPLPRTDFPILTTTINGQPLAYLDNAATSQKPRQVLDAMTAFYEHNNANVHRGVHALSVRATSAYEQARATVQRCINAAQPKEIIFTRNATEALNLVAHGLGATLTPDDQVIVSELEHHSNIVPWQVATRERGAKCTVWKMHNGALQLAELERLLTAGVTDVGTAGADKKTGFVKVVAVSHVSNVLGTVQPIKKITELAHKHGAIVVVDGAQAVGHTPVDVQALDADYYVFSGHKVYGPTGIGVLYGKRALLERLPPYQTGGDMIASVSFNNTTYAELPARFEAGTPNVAGAVGLAAALTYIEQHDLTTLAEHEVALATAAKKLLAKIPGVTILNPTGTTGIVTFVVADVHPHDVGTLLDQAGIAIRTGLLCAEPLVRSLGYDAVCRASFAGYNTLHEVERLAAAVKDVVQKFASKTPSQTGVTH